MHKRVSTSYIVRLNWFTYGWTQQVSGFNSWSWHYIELPVGTG